MKFKSEQPLVGTTRIFDWFAWYPIKTPSHWVWLEYVRITQVYKVISSYPGEPFHNKWMPYKVELINYWKD